MSVSIEDVIPRDIPDELRQELLTYLRVLESMGVVVRPESPLQLRLLRQLLDKQDAALMAGLARAVVELAPALLSLPRLQKMEYVLPYKLHLLISTDLGSLSVTVKPERVADYCANMPTCPYIYSIVLLLSDEAKRSIIELAKRYYEEKFGIRFENLWRKYLSDTIRIHVKGWDKKTPTITLEDVFPWIERALGSRARALYVNYYVKSRLRELLEPSLRKLLPVLRELLSRAKMYYEFYADKVFNQ